MKKTYLLSFCLIVLLGVSYGQSGNTKLFSVNFQQASIAQVVTDIESKSSYHFYYDPAQFDSLKVTLQVTDKPLATILDMAFDKTGFHFAITAQQQVFLTKGRQIKVELAPGFTEAAVANAPKQAAVADYTDEADKKVPDATTENKLYEIGIRTNNIKAGNSTISGYIRNIKSGEAIVGASIYLPTTKTGVATDQFGYFYAVPSEGKACADCKRDRHARYQEADHPLFRRKAEYRNAGTG